MSEKFSLKDHLFNQDTIGQLAAEQAASRPDFDAEAFQKAVLSGFAGRELMARLDWIADCLQPHLADDFPTMADQLEAAMPPVLDPTRQDDDFGHFIHAVPGILAVRHGLETHPERALDLIYAATQRFSMEFYIRPFLNRWPDDTLARLHLWADDPNYHVRRLVSEGTRPRLPWAKAVTLQPEQTLPLLDKLHADPTRYVTRSIANHLNDIAKNDAKAVIDRLAHWRSTGQQTPRELGWMERHALRSLIKAGNGLALQHLGYATDVPLRAVLKLDTSTLKIGQALRIDAVLEADQDLPVIVDYRVHFARPGGKDASKVFKLKTTNLTKNQPLSVGKTHRFKGNATTFRLYPGPHRVVLQVNGQDRDEATFTLTE